jgi:hypothetical protein
VTRPLPALLAILVAAGCGAAKQGAATSPTAVETSTTSTVTEQSVCPSEQEAGIEAVFGHRRTSAAAQRLAARAANVGFQGLVIQRRGCDDYAVVLKGLRSMRQAQVLRREADGVGFGVRIECRSHPVEGGLAAVFGHRPTKPAALQLLARAERVGFQGLRVQQDRCRDWEVDLYGITTPAQRRELAAEARQVGFHIVYELG